MIGRENFFFFEKYFFKKNYGQKASIGEHLFLLDLSLRKVPIAFLFFTSFPLPYKSPLLRLKRQ